MKTGFTTTDSRIQEPFMLDNSTYSGEDAWLREQFNADYSRKVLGVSVVFGLTACVGFVANLLVVYIYGVKYKLCNFKYFLFVLGLIGLGQCTLMLPTQVAEMHYWFNFPTSWLCRVSAYVFGYTVINCYSMLLLIALDRYRKVCRPYDWQIQPSTARNLCLLVAFASLILAAPPGIVSGHHRFVTSYRDTNISVTVCSTDDNFQKRDWAVYFLLLVGGVPVSIIIVITCTLYGIILKQFYSHGSGKVLKSLYSKWHTKVNLETGDKQKDDQNNLQILNQNALDNKDIVTGGEKQHTVVCMSESDSPAPSPQLEHKVLHLNLRRFLQLSTSSKNGSINSKRSVGTHSLRKTNSKRDTREKLLRKTLIMLIITVTCILALVVTFCLHIVAEKVNDHALHIPAVILNIFVIFHRGSVSIICALFPIIYSIRDQKFRHYLRQMVCSRRKSGAGPVTKTLSPPVTKTLSPVLESKC